MIPLTDTLNTALEGDCSEVLALSDETVITLDVKLKTGSHNNSRVTLQHSSDGLDGNWHDELHSTNGSGSITTVLATNFVKACVLTAEGSAASAKITITAK
jgi:hypothetical protein